MPVRMSTSPVVNALTIAFWSVKYWNVTSLMAGASPQ